MMKPDLAFFQELAEIAAQTSLPFFRMPLHVENKLQAGFDPVTEADRKTEENLRAAISRRYPNDGILGEEGGVSHPESDDIWVIDPIDGTRSFISGMPIWGSLVGLMHKNKAVAGMMAQPFTGELFAAVDEGAFYRHKMSWQPLKVAKTKRLEEATLFSTAPDLFSPEKKKQFEQVANKTRLIRWSADCYAFAMLAAGHVDLVIDTGLQPYDIMALIPIIEKAGGMVTQWNGGKAEKGGDIIAAATPELHAEACRLLGGA